MSQGQADRDILIELRSDVKHIREDIANFKQSESRQWEKIDAHGETIKGHDHSIVFLSKGFWLVAGGLVSACGVMAWFIISR